MSGTRPATGGSGTGRVVAELGRPETSRETAARKAESSRLHRQRQTINNLVYSLLATLGVVLIIVLIVPRHAPAGAITNNVDWKSIAAQGTGVEADPLLAPDLSSKWTSNAAELRDGGTGAAAGGTVSVWHIGFISPSSQYIGLDQGFNANDTWVADTLDNIVATGSTTVDGVKWVVYDNRDGQSSSKNVSYGMVAQESHSTVVLSGTASRAEFAEMADAVSSELIGFTK